MAPTVYTPPVNTYIPIGSVTLSATASEVTFSSIPATYRDLVLVFNGEKTSPFNGYAFQVRFNGDTGSNYSWVRMWGQGSSGLSDSSSGTAGSLGDFPAGSYSAKVMMRMQLQDYSATDKHKTYLAREDFDPAVSTYSAFAIAGRWANTNAVNQVSLLISGSQSFASGSTFSLYAIAG